MTAPAAAAPSSMLHEVLQRIVQVLLRLAGPIPRHVAFIMDGNRRFAEQESMQRIDGHAAGYRKVWFWHQPVGASGWRRARPQRRAPAAATDPAPGPPELTSPPRAHGHT